MREAGRTATAVGVPPPPPPRLRALAVVWVIPAPPLPQFWRPPRLPCPRLSCRSRPHCSTWGFSSLSPASWHTLKSFVHLFLHLFPVSPDQNVRPLGTKPTSCPVYSCFQHSPWGVILCSPFPSLQQCTPAPRGPSFEVSLGPVICFSTSATPSEPHSAAGLAGVTSFPCSTLPMWHLLPSV